MTERFASLIPNDNVYVIKTAADLPQVLDQWRIYHLLYDPGDGIGLYYSPDNITLVRIAAGGGSGGINPGTVVGSTTYWSGIVWAENPAVRWINPTNLLLNNDIAINWLDSVAVSQEMLILGFTGTVGGALEFDSIPVVASVFTSSTTYVDVTGTSLIPSTVGDEYLVLATSFEVCSFGLTGLNGIRILLDGVQMFQSDCDWEGGGTGLTFGVPWRYMNWFTYAAGDLHLQHKTNVTLGDVRTNQARISILNLTNLGAANHKKSRMDFSTLAMGTVYAGSTAAVTLGNGVDDWLIIICAIVDTPSAASTNIVVGLSDGITNFDLYRFEFERTTDKYAVMANFVVTGDISKTYTVIGRTISGTAVMEYASIVAINLTTSFAQYVIAQAAGPTTPPSGFAFDLITGNFTVTAPTGDWVFFGGENDAFPGSGFSGATEIDVDINSGGFNPVTWDNTIGFDLSNNATLDIHFKPLFPDGKVNLAITDVVDFRLRHLPAPNSAGEVLTNMFVVGFPLSVENTAVDEFIVGDPTIKTKIDGLPINFHDLYSFPNLDGTAGQVLSTDGAGIVSFVSLPAAATLQSAYNAAPAVPQIIVNATPAPLTIDASVAGDIFAVRAVGPSDRLRISNTFMDFGQSGRRTWRQSYIDATGRFGTELWPDNFTITTATGVGAAFYTDAARVITLNIPGGGGLGDDIAPAGMSFVHTVRFEDPGFVFASQLLINAAVKVECAANVGPLYLFLDQYRTYADGGSFTCTQHNAIRAQPSWGPNINGGSITQSSVALYLAIATVDATVGSATVTTMEYFSAFSPTLTAGGTIGTLNAFSIANIVGPSTIRGIHSLMNNGTFINHIGTAPSRFDGALNLSSTLGFGPAGVPDIVLSRLAANILTFADGDSLRITTGTLFFGTGGAGANFISSGAGNLQVTSDRLGFGIAPAGSNWAFAFSATARTITLAGDFANCLNTAGGNHTINAALSTFTQWTVNAPAGTLGTGSVVDAANMIIQTAPGVGTNRYGLLITSNPSGGTLNYAFRQSNASARARFDGRLDINRGIALGGGAAATLGTIGGSGPTAAAQAQWLEIDIGGVPHWIPVWT